MRLRLPFSYSYSQRLRLSIDVLVILIGSSTLVLVWHRTTTMQQHNTDVNSAQTQSDEPTLTPQLEQPSITQPTPLQEQPTPAPTPSPTLTPEEEAKIEEKLEETSRELEDTTTLPAPERTRRVEAEQAELRTWAAENHLPLDAIDLKVKLPSLGL